MRTSPPLPASPHRHRPRRRASVGLGAFQPGCNCEEELVAEIVEELKKRMKTRGDTGQIQRAEQQLTEIMKVQSDMAALNSKVDAILAHLEIRAPVPQAMAVPC